MGHKKVADYIHKNGEINENVLANQEFGSSMRFNIERNRGDRMIC